METHFSIQQIKRDCELNRQTPERMEWVAEVHQTINIRGNKIKNRSWNVFMGKVYTERKQWATIFEGLMQTCMSAQDSQ